jgi:8-oxo-dGTP pyrophosphatase MutT (NUDIX family)
MFQTNQPMIEQSGVLPYCLDARGRTWVLLITSRRAGRWILPKGMIEPELTPRESAAQEALEEAGVQGSVADQPIGSYSYDKWGRWYLVRIYPMRVTQQHERWDEDDRERRWLLQGEAARAVQQPALARLIQRFRPEAQAEVS